MNKLTRTLLLPLLALLVILGPALAAAAPVAPPDRTGARPAQPRGPAVSPGVPAGREQPTGGAGFSRSEPAGCDAITRVDFSWMPLTPTVGQSFTLSATVWADRFGPEWFTETVDVGEGYGGYTSLALDRAESPRLSYLLGPANAAYLKYAWRTESGWQTELLDYVGMPGPGYTALVLDAQGNPRVGYMDQMNAAAMYAWYTQGLWWTQPIERGLRQSSGFVSLALDTPGSPRLSYYDSTGYYSGSLVYAQRNGPGWITETVASGDRVGYGTALAVDEQDLLHLAFYKSPSTRDGALCYAHYDGTRWVSETVDAGRFEYGDNPSLVLDAAGRPHIGYADSSYGHSSGVLFYASWNGTAWITQTVDPYQGAMGGGAAASPSLILDSSGNPHLSYCLLTDYSPYPNDLRYAYWDGTTWITQTVDQVGQTGAFTSLALDSRGNPHISYYDYDHHAVRYAQLETHAVSPTLPVTYTWDLGDGTTASGPVVHHQYGQPGRYTVTVTATNCMNVVVTARHLLTVITPCEPVHNPAFAWTPPVLTAGQVVTLTGVASGTWPISYTWDLGDGTLAEGGVISHRYALPGEYPVHLTATNCAGRVATAAQTVTVGPSCDPVEMVRVTTAISDCRVTFGAALSGTAPLAYAWDFGSWGVSTAMNPLVDFGSSGSYPYTLTASNCVGAYTATAAGTVTVTCCEPPHGTAVTWQPAAPLTGQPITGTAQAEGTAPLTYTWDLGDGFTATGAVVVHAYAAAETYTVTVRAENGCGVEEVGQVVAVGEWRIYLPLIVK